MTRLAPRGLPTTSAPLALEVVAAVRRDGANLPDMGVGFVKRAGRGAAGVDAWRRLIFCWPEGAVVRGFACLFDGDVSLIFAGWLPQDGAFGSERHACLESSVTARQDGCS